MDRALSRSWVAVLLVVLGASSLLGGTDDKRPPRLLWENRGQQEFLGGGGDTETGRHVLVVPGVVGNESGNLQWFVRGVDQRSGETLWEDRFGPVLFGWAHDAAIEGRRAFVSGWTFTFQAGFEFVVRAYDLTSGSLLWSRQVGLGDQCREERPGFGRCVAKAVDVRHGRVFVAGHLTRTAARSDFALLAFDAATGAPLWESVTDLTGTGSTFDFAWSVAARGDGVFVVGEVGNQSGLLVQSHDAATGTVRWRQHVPGAANGTLKNSFAADRHRVYVAGVDAESRFMVQAYDAKTGVLDWEDRVDDGGGWATALALDSGGGEDDESHGERGDREGSARLFAAGVTGCDVVTFLDCELAVRAYDLRGTRVWQRADPAIGGDWVVPYVAAAGEGRLYVAAQELLADGQYHGRIHSYAVEDGALEWTVPVDEGSGSPIGHMDGLALRAGRLFAAGLLFRPDGGGDFLLRAYRVH